MDLDEDVLEMVRRQLDRDPPPSTSALYGRAVRINDDIYELSLRQFHAKYPLRVKRERARREREEGAPATVPAGEDGASPDTGPDEAEDGPSADVPEDAGRRHLFGAEDAAGQEAGAAGGGPAATTRAAGQGDRSAAGDAVGVRDRVRGVLMSLAREIAEAEQPEALVGVVQRMPDRVDELARIVGGPSPRG